MLGEKVKCSAIAPHLCILSYIQRAVLPTTFAPSPWLIVVVVVVVVMEISTAPYLLKILQPKVRTKAIQTTITSHRHTHTHTHTRTHTHTLTHFRDFNTGVCHVTKITTAESNPGMLTQQTLRFSTNVLDRADKDANNEKVSSLWLGHFTGKETRSLYTLCR